MRRRPRCRSPMTADRSVVARGRARSGGGRVGDSGSGGGGWVVQHRPGGVLEGCCHGCHWCVPDQLFVVAHELRRPDRVPRPVTCHPSARLFRQHRGQRQLQLGIDRLQWQLDLHRWHRQPVGLLGSGHDRHRHGTPRHLGDSSPSISCRCITRPATTACRRARVQNFPPGLRMVAGTAQRNSAGNNNGGVVLYSCLSNGATSESFPSCAPGDSLVMTVRFPQCWDGINLDAPDHKSHMAYGVGWGQGANGGGCPTSHTTPLAEITQNYRYQVPASGMSTWRLSSDTYSGPRRILRTRRLVERLGLQHLPTRRRQLLPRRPRLPHEPPRRRTRTPLER